MDLARLVVDLDLVGLIVDVTGGVMVVDIAKGRRREAQKTILTWTTRNFNFRIVRRGAPASYGWREIHLSPVDHLVTTFRNHGYISGNLRKTSSI